MNFLPGIRLQPVLLVEQPFQLRYLLPKSSILREYLETPISSFPRAWVWIFLVILVAVLAQLLSAAFLTLVTRHGSIASESTPWEYYVRNRPERGAVNLLFFFFYRGNTRTRTVFGCASEQVEQVVGGRLAAYPPVKERHPWQGYARSLELGPLLNAIVLEFVQTTLVTGVSEETMSGRGKSLWTDVSGGIGLRLAS